MLKVIACFYTDLLLVMLPTLMFIKLKMLTLIAFYLLFVFEDTVIYDRLAETSKYKEITLKHLEQFATEGEYNTARQHD